jgi:hypothetical protein
MGQKSNAILASSEPLLKHMADAAAPLRSCRALLSLIRISAGHALWRMQDSTTEGIGYEDKLKLSGGYAAPYYEMDQAERMAMGTKAIKAKGKK